MAETLDPKIVAAVRMENALIAISRATDARGLKIILITARPPPGTPLLFGSAIPSSRDFRRRIDEFCCNLITASWELKWVEKAHARNLALLAGGWLAALEYEEATRA